MVHLQPPSFRMISYLCLAALFSVMIMSSPAAGGPAAEDQTLTPTSTSTPTLEPTPEATPTFVLTPLAHLPALLLQPTPTPSPSPAPSGIPPDNLLFEQAVIDLLNEQRAAAALPPLRLDERLTQAARRHGRDMADNNQLSHTGSDGSTAGQRIQEAGYTSSWHGENIGWGFTSPQSMVSWWMNSPPHRANILHTQFTDIGAAYGWNGSSPYKHHWVLNFGRPAGADAGADLILTICIDSTPTEAPGGSALTVQPGACD